MCPDRSRFNKYKLSNYWPSYVTHQNVQTLVTQLIVGKEQALMDVLIGRRLYEKMGSINGEDFSQSNYGFVSRVKLFTIKYIITTKT